MAPKPKPKPVSEGPMDRWAKQAATASTSAASTDVPQNVQPVVDLTDDSPVIANPASATVIPAAASGPISQSAMPIGEHNPYKRTADTAFPTTSGQALSGAGEQDNVQAGTKMTTTARRERSKGGRSRQDPQQRNPQEINISAALEGVDAAVGNGKSAGAIHSDPQSAFLQRLIKAISTVEMAKTVGVTVVGAEVVKGNLNQLFGQPAIDGRQWQPKTEMKTGTGRVADRWLFWAVDGQKKLFMGTKTRSTVDNENVAKAINNALVGLLNSWPGPTIDTVALAKPPDRWRMSRYHMMILRAAEMHVDARLPLHVRRGLISKAPRQKAGYVVTAEAWYIDADTYEPCTSSLNIPVQEFSDNTSVQFPSNVRLCTQPGGIGAVSLYDMVTDPQTGLDFPVSMVPADLGHFELYRSAIRTAEKIGDVFVAETHGKIIRKEDFRTYAREWLEQYATSTRTNARAAHLVYGGAGLYQLDRNLAKRKQIIKASDPVRSHVAKSKFPFISIDSLDRSDSAAAVNELVQKFQASGDIKAAFIACAYKADALNQDIREGVRRSVLCDCSPEASHHIQHVCGACGVAVLCSTLSFGSYGLRVCPRCLSSEKAATETLPMMVLRKLARVQLWIEAKATGLDPSSQQQTDDMEALSASFLKLFENDPNIIDAVTGHRNNKWKDAYTGAYHATQPYNLFGPLELSAEAVDPYSLGANDVVRIHAAGNVKPVAMTLNYGKHIQLPGFLQRIRNHLDKRERYEATYKDEPDKLARELLRLDQQLIAATEQLRKTRLKASWSKVSRTNKKVSPQQMKLSKQEFKSGKLRPRHQKSNLPWNIPQYDKGTADYKMSRKDIERINTICAGMEQEFKVQLPRAADGAHWFGVPGAMPPGWSWSSASRLISSRFWRLWQWCNGLYETEDDCVNLFCFIMLTVCIERTNLVDGVRFDVAAKKYLKQRYGEFLGLPRKIELHDGLCLSIGKAEHGRQMRTGFPIGATSFGQWDEKRCNMLAETRISNFAKLDFPKETYPDVKQAIRSVDLTKDLYDPSIDMSNDVDLDTDVVTVLPPGAKLDVDDEALRPPPRESGDESHDPYHDGSLFVDDDTPEDVEMSGPGDNTAVYAAADTAVEDAAEAMQEAHDDITNNLTSVYQHLASDARVQTSLKTMQAAFDAGDAVAFNKHVSLINELFASADEGTFKLEHETSATDVVEAHDNTDTAAYPGVDYTRPLSELDAGQLMLMHRCDDMDQRVRDKHPLQYNDSKIQACLKKMRSMAREMRMADMFNAERKLVQFLTATPAIPTPASPAPAVATAPQYDFRGQGQDPRRLETRYNELLGHIQAYYPSSMSDTFLMQQFNGLEDALYKNDVVNFDLRAEKVVLRLPHLPIG